MVWFIIAVVVFVLIKLSYEANQNRLNEDAHCRSCGWVGSTKLWEKHKGCPHCKSDRLIPEWEIQNLKDIEKLDVKIKKADEDFEKRWKDKHG